MDVSARLEAAATALATLREALAVEAPSRLERDGTIQRFKYTFEVMWKACRAWLKAVEDLSCASPRSCFRTLGEVGVLDPEETAAALAMIEDRNLTVHTYDEHVAEAILARLPAHAALMETLLGRLRERLPG